jgi:hypothetical protein
MTPARWRLAACVAGAALVFIRFGAAPTDWELLVGKHYWSRGFFYGGYAYRMLPSSSGYRGVHLESQTNLQNVDPLTESGPYPWPHKVGGFPGTERLLAPFLAAGFQRASAFRLEALDAFWLVNVGAWLVAIVAAFRIASVFFTYPWSPVCAAILVAAYPAFTLTFTSIKVQQIGTAYLLAGIWLYEVHLRRSGPVIQCLGLMAAMWIGLFASGGWAFLAVYLLGRELWLRESGFVFRIAALIAAFVAVRAGLSQLTHSYELPAADNDVSYVAIASQSIEWALAWWRGADRSAHKFLNFPGDSFFQLFVPTIFVAFVRGHGLMMLAAAVACWRIPAARMFAVIALPMFAMGHLGTALTGWAGWHYGYLSAPAAALLILAASAGLGRAISEPRAVPRVIAAAVVILTVGLWMDLKTHAGLYWGGNPAQYRLRVVVYGDAPGEAVEF